MKTLILGLGISGRAAAEFLLAQGKAVVGFDDGVKEMVPGIPSCDVSLDFSTIEQVVVSPGIAPSHPLYQKAVSLGIEVIGEVELALRHLSQPCIGITGTNGKTTVTLLVEHLLRFSGIPARALGNVGTPLSSYCHGLFDPREVLVIELSSYQLETLQMPVFDAGVILNITPDHLDRHASIEEYARAKCRLQYCLKSNAPLYVYDEVLREFGNLLTVDNIEAYAEITQPLFYDGGAQHDRENALAAWALVRKFGVSAAQFCEGMKIFKKPPHRIEFVAEVDGVRYYNDSKGTNVHAVIRAVEAMPGPVVLLAGGVDKGLSYALWKHAFAQKVKKLVVFGQAASKIYEELSVDFPIEKVDSLEYAVARASESVQAGECVLLSPGCASFDMFRNYAHRGDEFKRFVAMLQERRKIT